ncbi:MAG: UPF0182 family protein [Actinomycetes bacterium]
MRAPQLERRRFRIRGWMIALVVVLIVLLLSVRGLAGFWTDFLWFQSLGQAGTWTQLLGAKVLPAVVFMVVFFVIMLASLVIADRLTPHLRTGPVTAEDEMVTRYRTATARFTGRIRVAIALFFAFIAGLGVSAQWKEWILFTHRVDFGVKDPQFHRDIGFYVFQLPFIRFIADWLFAGLVIVLLVTAVAYYLNGGIRFQSPIQRVSPQVKAHLSVILAVMALVKTAQYWFGRFELDYSTRGAVDGAGYTAVKAELPALNLLVFISVVAALLFLWNIRRRGWVLPIIAVGLWGFVSIVVGAIYPALIQQFQVNPNEFAKERPYIKRNIEATRQAFGLSQVKPTNYDFSQELTADQVAANKSTIDNARLWDPGVLAATYAQIQQFQSYYKVDGVDVDRYTVDGQTVQTAVSLREIDSNALPTQSWINQRILYTHGYGVIASPTNQQTDGQPNFYLSNIPIVQQGLSVDTRGTQIYFGEQESNYIVTGARQPEFNYPRQGVSDSLTRYRGPDGVQFSNFWRKAAFALRFNDINLLVSGQIEAKSKIMLYRSIRSRVEKLAPFLGFDSNPYPVVENGHTLWVIDAYTSTSKYPYAQSIEGASGLAGSFNYARNAVKATVDAYSGRVHFYVVDAKDPIIRSWRSAFPKLFSSFDAMPDALKDHLRYPEDLFRVQTEVYARYHVTEPRRFFQGSERWLISPDPTEALSGVGITTSGTSARTNQRAPEIKATSKRADPYYLYIRLPGDDRESFLMLQSFVPVSQDNQQLRLVSFFTAKADRRNYGELQSFVMPQGQLVDGPVQAALKINQDPNISATFTLLDQKGSQVVKGNMQLIPVGDSIVYVQPVYIEGDGASSFPVYQYVAVFAQGRDPVLANTVNEALAKLFPGVSGATPGTAVPPSTSTPSTPSTPNNSSGQSPAGSGTVESILAQAAQKFNDAGAALRAGDLGRYQTLVQEAQALVAQAQQLLSAGASAAPTTSTTAARATSTAAR